MAGREGRGAGVTHRMDAARGVCRVPPPSCSGTPCRRNCGRTPDLVVPSTGTPVNALAVKLSGGTRSAALRAACRPEASCCENATRPTTGTARSARSAGQSSRWGPSDRHRPRSGRNSWASFRRMAPPSKGMARRQRRAATPLSPSLFRVPAMGRNSAGSFAACGRDAGLKTGAPGPLCILMPGGLRRRTRAWVLLPVGAGVPSRRSHPGSCRPAVTCPPVWRPLGAR